MVKSENLRFIVLGEEVDWLRFFSARDRAFKGDLVAARAVQDAVLTMLRRGIVGHRDNEGYIIYANGREVDTFEIPAFPDLIVRREDDANVVAGILGTRYNRPEPSFVRKPYGSAA